MKLNLSILDRLSLNAVLPKEGSVLEMITSESVSDKVKLSTDDIEKSGLTNVGQGVNVKDNYSIEVELNGPEVTILKDTLKKLDDAKTFPSYLLGIYKQVNAETAE